MISSVDDQFPSMCPWVVMFNRRMFESFEGFWLHLSLAGPLAVPRLGIAAYNKHHTKQPTETKPTRNKFYCWFVNILSTVVVPVVPFVLQSDEYVNLVNTLEYPFTAFAPLPQTNHVVYCAGVAAYIDNTHIIIPAIKTPFVWCLFWLKQPTPWVGRGKRSVLPQKLYRQNYHTYDICLHDDDWASE
jgi:hypothetical protein